MNKIDADKVISSYIKKIFGFSMSKLSDISKAEELASEITIQAYCSLLRQDGIENMDGARITFSYDMKNEKTGRPVATARSVHCFLKTLKTK